jgi:general secretion pathway protein G
MIQRSLEKKRSGEGGFTLVELLIVIVILGILAAIVVLAIGGLSDHSKNAACEADAKTIEVAQDAYYASLGNNTNYASLAQLLGADLLKSDPNGAAGAADDKFTVTGGAGTYTITGINDCDGITPNPISYP